MSPPPCRFKQTDVDPPPGMKNATAPGVNVPGRVAFDPVLGSTQWASFARSPRGGVPAAGSALGRPAATGGCSKSGGVAPPDGQLLMVTLPLVPVSVQNVRPLQLAFPAT